MSYTNNNIKQRHTNPNTHTHKHGTLKTKDLISFCAFSGCCGNLFQINVGFPMRMDLGPPLLGAGSCGEMRGEKSLREEVRGTFYIGQSISGLRVHAIVEIRDYPILGIPGHPVLISNKMVMSRAPSHFQERQLMTMLINM